MEESKKGWKRRKKNKEGKRERLEFYKREKED